MYLDEGRFAEGGTLLAEALNIGKREFGEENPSILSMRRNMAIALAGQGRYERDSTGCGELVRQHDQKPFVLQPFAASKSLSSRLETEFEPWERVIFMLLSKSDQTRSPALLVKFADAFVKVPPSAPSSFVVVSTISSMASAC